MFAIRIGQGKCKKSLEHFVMPESKEVIKKMMETCEEDTEPNLKELL